MNGEQNGSMPAHPVDCQWADDAVSKLVEAEARAERLAEAGRRVTAAFRAHGEAVPFTREADRTRHECESAMLALDAALDQEAGRG